MRKLFIRSAGLLLLVSLLTCLYGKPASAAFDPADGIRAMPAILDYQDTTSSTYISMMEGGDPGLINGNSQPYADEQDNGVVWLKIYAQKNTQRTITLNLVKRDVGEDQACDKYTISADYYGLNPNELSTIQTVGVDAPAATPGPPSGNITGAGNIDCVGSYVTIQVPAGVLGESDTPAHDGIFTGLVRLSIVGVPGSSKHSPTFRASISGACAAASTNCARIGYSGQLPGVVNPRVAIYPSNLNNDYTIDFPFAPPCDTPGGPKTIQWYDDDRGVTGGNQQVNSNVKNFDMILEIITHRALCLSGR